MNTVLIKSQVPKIEGSKESYEKPIIQKEEQMSFPLGIINTVNGRMICKQCSSCHSCR